MGDWALITGATAGIGHELARLFAADKWNLILVARNEARLGSVAAELKSLHGIETRIIPSDLSRPHAAEEIFNGLRDLPVSALINNAGFGSYGDFHKSDLASQSGMVQVNVLALIELTHLFLKPMLERRRGAILNVASTAAFQPGPTMNVYYATKAFVYSFSYALADELEGTGITVTTLCPGLTRTEFQARAGLKPSGHWPAMDARKVAEIGYRGFKKGRRVVIAGAGNKIASFFARRAPQRLTSAVVRRVHSRS